ncbi:MAG: hypothetical protein DWQ06_04415 [Calditrichaeota bacterium]|nr:MAG: hypothetical protein DWQ06_04415 [Calditrichota bacterium]
MTFANLLILLFLTFSFTISQAESLKEEKLYKNKNWERFEYHLKEHSGTAAVFSPSEKLIHGHEAEEQVPLASVAKVPSAYFVLEKLGKDYRPQTQFYLEKSNLVVLGEYDPFLTTEEIKTIADTLARSLKLYLADKIDTLKIVQNETIQGNFFDRRIPPGAKETFLQYNAMVLPVQANFNSIKFRKRGRNIAVYNLRYGTKSSRIPNKLYGYLRSFRNGTYNVNLNYYKRGNVYFGDYLQMFLEKKGVKIKVVAETPKPESMELHYSHFNSKTVEEMCEVMLKYSNNVIANSLNIMASYQDCTGVQASIGAEKLNEFWESKGVDLILEEGSGISIESKASAKAVCEVFVHFKKYKYLLSKGSFGVPSKTGTLSSDGVTTLAGYLPDNQIFFFYLPEKYGAKLRKSMVRILKRGIRANY